MVEDESFSVFVKMIDSAYVLHTKHELKDLVTPRYKVTKEKVEEAVKGPLL